MTEMKRMSCGHVLHCRLPSLLSELQDLRTLLRREAADRCRMRTEVEMAGRVTLGPAAAGSPNLCPSGLQKMAGVASGPAFSAFGCSWSIHIISRRSPLLFVGD